MQLNELLNDPGFVGSLPHRTLIEKPLGFIDIGARGGIHDMVLPLAAATAVLGFEPDPVECENLKQKLTAESPWALWKLESVALAEREKDAILHCMLKPTNNSLLPCNVDFVERYQIETLKSRGTQPLKTYTLDQVVFDEKHKDTLWGEMIKLDVQGTEYEILQGAKKTLLERTMVVLTEVEFFPVYHGQKLFSDIEVFLRGYGFSFYGFTTMHYRSCKKIDKREGIGRERLHWADAVFFKDPLRGGLESKILSQRSHAVLFVGALLLGYLDFALEIALSTWAVGREETLKIEELIRRHAKQQLSDPWKEVQRLSEEVKNNPTDAAIQIGHFIDHRYHLGNYEDV
jgi:FkbM family methyltransferase